MPKVLGAIMGLLLASFLGASSGASAEEYEYYGWQSDHLQGGRFYTKQPQCVDIPSDLRLCHNIGYRKMRVPNLLEHDTLPEIKQQASSWVPLLAKRCHPDTQIFLCSLFAPICLDRPIYPCHSLCQAVRDGCSPVMESFGFPWPEMLKCDRFPLDNDLCVSLQSPGNPATQPPAEMFAMLQVPQNLPAQNEAIQSIGLMQGLFQEVALPGFLQEELSSQLPKPPKNTGVWLSPAIPDIGKQSFMDANIWHETEHNTLKHCGKRNSPCYWGCSDRDSYEEQTDSSQIFCEVITVP
ncbi:secreted frizzled-related protein 5-like [Rhincodon typus]|uniref:secreted frizzled-related protein 5-like n=1 Tax=Rhincodon typus TaxID=259920 RepID=UPI00202FE026|nr:secreted frizzled-related protein 5-like [Rhincodon typus]